MSTPIILSIDLIASDPAVRGGRPIIAGTTLRVQDIAIGFVDKGYSVETLLEAYPQLTHAQVHAALAYYYAHQGRIDADIAADEALFAQAKAASALSTCD